MAEGDGVIYNEFKYRLGTGAIDLANDTLKMILVAGHSVDIDGDTTYADVSGDEVSGTGYTAGGATLSGVAWAKDTSGDRAWLDANNVTYTGLDVGTPSHAILYDDTASDYLIAAWEVTTPSNTGNYTLQFGASGIMQAT